MAINNDKAIYKSYHICTCIQIARLIYGDTCKIMRPAIHGKIKCKHISISRRTGMNLP